MNSVFPQQRKFHDPKIIGQWKVGRTIGKGCSGRVRIARHSKTGQFAAIKIISKSSLASRVSLNRLPDEVEREKLAVEREIVVMKLINHPNIMHLYDVWETSTHLYLVLEYIQGGELFDHLCKRGPLPVPETLKYFQQIISAVDYFHRFNIAHRDLKPENILLDQNSNIKIADFGMAAWQIDTQGLTDLMKTSCGSPHYAAPEIIRGERYVGSSADIWSCGVILYAMLTAQLPFDDDNLPELLDKVAAGKFTIPPFVDPVAQNLIRRMLMVDVKKRITMSEIFEHPFFRLHIFRTPTCAVPELSRIAHSLKSKSCIDPDIFANLRTLWHGASDEQLIKSLLDEDKNWQKGIYHLLVNYRANQAEEDEVSESEMERRRARKAKKIADKAKRATINVEGQEASRPVTPSGSIHFYPPRAEPPTPRKARGNHLTPGIAIDSSNSENLGQLLLDTKIPGPALTDNANTRIKLDLNRALPEIPVPELQDRNVQAFFEQVVNHLNLLQDKMGNTPSAADRTRHEELYKFAQAAGQNHPGLTKLNAPALMDDGDWEDIEPEKPNKAGRQLVFSLGQDTRSANRSTTRAPEATRPLTINRKSKRTPANDHPNTMGPGNKENAFARDDGTNCFLTVSETLSLRRKLSMNRRYGADQEGEELGYNRHKQVLGDVGNGRPLHPRQCQPRLPSEQLSERSGGSPKRTWLDTIFRLKPSHSFKCTLYSTWDLITTRNECRRLLMNMNIHVQVFQQSRDSLSSFEDSSSSAITMKCKMDEVQELDDILGVLKATKFRVEMRNIRRPNQRPVILPAPSGGSESSSDNEDRVRRVTATLIHEKGSGESFREIVRRLRREWTLSGDRSVGVL